MTIIYFVIAIGILILVHELGHFLLARRNDIRVEKFSIGFGPKIVSFKRGETEYKIAPIPLGGYVKMTGEDPGDAEAASDPRSFAQKSIWTRIKVVSAGPIMNILLAFLLMSVVFMLGRMEPSYLSETPRLMGVKKDSPAAREGLRRGDIIKAINGKEMSSWDGVQKEIIISAGQTLNFEIDRDGLVIEKKIAVETLPELKVGFVGIEPLFFMGDEARIDQVMANGPAAKAGIKAGDRVLTIDNKPVEGWTEMAGIIHSSGGKDITLTVERGEERFEVRVKPNYNKTADKWVIGIVKGIRPSDVPMKERKYGFIEAIKNGFNECFKLIGLTFAVVKKLFTLQLSYKSLGGPIQIAQASAAAASYGISEFLYFLAFLSLQLGILNLLPIPILDGGHILFCGIEAVIRRPVPEKVRSVAQYVGLVFLLTLFLFITINDIDSVWGIKNLGEKVLNIFK